MKLPLAIAAMVSQTLVQMDLEQKALNTNFPIYTREQVHRASRSNRVQKRRASNKVAKQSRKKNRRKK